MTHIKNKDSKKEIVINFMVFKLCSDNSHLLFCLFVMISLKVGIYFKKALLIYPVIVLGYACSSRQLKYKKN